VLSYKEKGHLDKAFHVLVVIATEESIAARVYLIERTWVYFEDNRNAIVRPMILVGIKPLQATTSISQQRT